MSLPDRQNILSLLAAAALAACGFAPAYGPASPARGLLNHVSIAPPSDKNAFDLVERLEERLGRPVGGTMDLTYRIETSETGLAITPSNAITRYTVDGSVSFTLTDVVDRREIASGKVTSFTAYSASGTTVSTAASRQDAYQRLMRLLADQVVTRLVASAASGAVP
jgi:LPS-assembly lipoprotein